MASDQEGRESRLSGGGKYCVAGGPGGVSCSNGQYTEGVSIHHFPDQNKDKDLYLKWVQFVRKHRPSFKGLGPRSKEILCSAHFKDECLNIRKDIAEQIGIRRTPVKGAYPSIDVAGVVQLDPEPFMDRSRRMFAVLFASLNQVYFAGQTTESRSHHFVKYLSRKGRDFIAQYEHTYCSDARFLYDREVWFPLDQNLGSDRNAIEESFRIQPCFDLMQRD